MMFNHHTTELFINDLEVPARTWSARRARASATSSTAGTPSASSSPRSRSATATGSSSARAATLASARSSAGRSAPTRACSSRSPRPTPASRPPTLMRDKAAWLFDPGQSAARRRTWRSCSPPRPPGRPPTPAWTPRRLRLRRGVRRRAQVPRDAALHMAPVSNNMVLAYVGQHVLGMPRSY